MAALNILRFEFVIMIKKNEKSCQSCSTPEMNIIVLPQNRFCDKNIFIESPLDFKNNNEQQ
jgi:hypothetical protein